MTPTSYFAYRVGMLCLTQPNRVCLWIFTGAKEGNRAFTATMKLQAAVGKTVWYSICTVHAFSSHLGVQQDSPAGSSCLHSHGNATPWRILYPPDGPPSRMLPWKTTPDQLEKTCVLSEWLEIAFDKIYKNVDLFLSWQIMAGLTTSGWTHKPTVVLNQNMEMLHLVVHCLTRVQWKERETHPSENRESTVLCCSPGDSRAWEAQQKCRLRTGVLLSVFTDFDKKKWWSQHSLSLVKPHQAHAEGMSSHIKDIQKDGQQSCLPGNNFITFVTMVDKISVRWEK